MGRSTCTSPAPSTWGSASLPATQGPRRPPPSGRGGVAGLGVWPCALPFPTFRERTLALGSRPACVGCPSSGARRRRTGSGRARRCPCLFSLEGTAASRPRGNPGRSAEVAAALGQRRESVLQPSGRRRSRRRSSLSRGRRGWGGGRGVDQDGGQGGDAAVAAAAVAGVSARLAAPSQVPRWGRAPGPRPAPQARGRASYRALPAPGE